MSEWWTYRLSDFLLFSPRTYYRLFELHNEAVWPAQLAALALGVAVLFLLRRPGAAQSRLIAAVLVAAWLFVAAAYHQHRYATINWAAPWFALGFAIEAALLLWVGVVRGRLVLRPGRIGLFLYIFALFAYPLIAPLLGRGWKQAEVFGVAPDPTAIATLALLFCASSGARWLLLPLPLLWCAVSFATMWAMGSPEAWIMPLACVLTLAPWRGRRA